MASSRNSRSTTRAHFSRENANKLVSLRETFLPFEKTKTKTSDDEPTRRPNTARHGAPRTAPGFCLWVSTIEGEDSHRCSSCSKSLDDGPKVRNARPSTSSSFASLSRSKVAPKATKPAREDQNQNLSSPCRRACSPERRRPRVASRQSRRVRVVVYYVVQNSFPMRRRRRRDQSVKLVEASSKSSTRLPRRRSRRSRPSSGPSRTTLDTGNCFDFSDTRGARRKPRSW